GPRLNHVIADAMTALGQTPKTLQEMVSSADPSRALTSAFATAGTLFEFLGLVGIYFGFLVASREAVKKKVDGLYDTESQRQGARRVVAAVRNAVEQYMRLQTLKAGMIALVAWILMFVLGVKDALFIAFVVFLSAYVPIVGAFAGSIFPGLVALS